MARKKKAEEAAATEAAQKPAWSGHRLVLVRRAGTADEIPVQATCDQYESLVITHGQENVRLVDD